MIYGDFGFPLMPATFGPAVDCRRRDAVRARRRWSWWLFRQLRPTRRGSQASATSIGPN